MTDVDGVRMYDFVSPNPFNIHPFKPGVHHGVRVCLVCSGCRQYFQRTPGYVRYWLKHGNGLLFCSRRCSTVHGTGSFRRLPETTIQKIQSFRSQKRTIAWIAKKLNLCQNTILKYGKPHE